MSSGNNIKDVVEQITRSVNKHPFLYLILIIIPGIGSLLIFYHDLVKLIFDIDIPDFIYHRIIGAVWALTLVFLFVYLYAWRISLSGANNENEALDKLQYLIDHRPLDSSPADDMRRERYAQDLEEMGIPITVLQDKIYISICAAYIEQMGLENGIEYVKDTEEEILEHRPTHF